MAAASDLDPKAVRRQFARRASRLHEADFLLRETERRLLERLEIVRMQPATILDVGCGLGRSLGALSQRYPQARLFGCDQALPVIRRARETLTPTRQGLLARLRGRPAEPIAEVFAGDARLLALADSSIDMIWSNLVFHWFDDPLPVVEEWQRVIRPQGLLTFSLLGVDSFLELRQAGARTMRFPDMHDIGDLLVAAGFAEPVMDMDKIVLTYREPEALLADVRVLGGNALRDRFRGLLGRSQRNEWLAAIGRTRGSDGLLRITLELVFGQAWCPSPKRLPRGLAPVRIVPRKPR